MTADILNLSVYVCAIFQMVATYSYGRKTARWPMALFYNMLDVSAYNAFVLWREIDPTWKQSAPNYKRRYFLEELGRALVSPYVKSRQYGPRTQASLLYMRKLQDEDEEAAGPSTAGPPTARPSRAVNSMADPSTTRPSRAGPFMADPSMACPSAKRKRGPRCLPRDVKTTFVCKKCQNPVCKRHCILICDLCYNP